MAVRIAGTGSYTPERILSNQDLEAMVETSDEWITTRTGIKTRHIAPPAMPSSDLALNAAKNALENAGITPADLDFISVATATGDLQFPSTACILHGKLGGGGKCACYDIAAACSGLLYSTDIGINLLRGHKNYKYGLIVGSEKLSSIVDWKDRSTCVLFGDGAAALVIEKTDGLEEAQDFMLASVLRADGAYTGLLYGYSGIPADLDKPELVRPLIRMNGKEVFKLAVPAMVSGAKTVLAEAGIDISQVRWIIPHQANQRIINAVTTRLGAAPEQVYSNIQEYGNTSAASVGICLDELNRSGKLQRGDLVLATSFGSGLTWASILIRW